MIENFN